MINYVPSGIPQELKDLQIWALSAENQQNMRGHVYSPKAPLIPTGEYAKGIKPNDPTTWLDFDTVDAWQDVVGGYPGLMIQPPYIGIDFDLQKAGPEYRAWVEDECLPRCPGYVERSPSGNGYRVIIKGEIAKSRKTPILEVYNKDRFLRMTGNTVVSDCPKLEAQAWLDWIYPANGEDIEPQDAVAITEVSFEEAKATYERVMPLLRHNDRAAIEMADKGQTTGSDAAFSVCVALAKVPEMDPSTAYVILLAQEGIQQHYAATYKDNARKELHRKFTEYWWPKAAQVAPKAIKKDAEEDKQIEEIKSIAKEKVAELIAKKPTIEGFPAFPVPVMREYRDWLAGSVVESEETIVSAGALSHLSSIVSRRYTTSTNSMLNLFICVLAEQGSGKQVLTSGYEQLQDQTQFPRDLMLKWAGSDIGMHKQVTTVPDGLLVISEFGDRLRSCMRQGSPTRGLPTFLKEIYGINAGDSYRGIAYSDSQKDLQKIYSPALNVLAEGTREQVLDALGLCGTEDGFLGRWIFIDAGRRWIDNDVPRRKIEPQLLEYFKALFMSCLRASQTPGTLPFIPVTLDSAADDLLRAFTNEARVHRRSGEPHTEAFWRSAAQNANKVASVAAVYANSETPVVTGEFMEWGIAVVRWSVNTALNHGKVDGAYEDDDGRAAAAMKDAIRYFFEGKQGHTDAAKKAREEGYFRVGYLSHLKNAIKNHPKGKAMGIEIALQLLLAQGMICEVAEKTHGFKHKLSTMRFTLGEMWRT